MFIWFQTPPVPTPTKVEMLCTRRTQSIEYDNKQCLRICYSIDQQQFANHWSCEADMLVCVDRPNISGLACQIPEGIHAGDEVAKSFERGDRINF